MKVDWKIIPDWLTTVTAEVIDAGHGLTLDGPTAWSGSEHLQPKIWVDGCGVASWQDEGEHLLFATLPDYAVEFEVGDTTETCIQFRPQSTEQPAQHEMTPEMMRKVQMHSELGAYAASNLVGAYDLFQEFWRVAMSAAPQPALAEQQEPVNQRAHEMALRQWDHWTQYALELQEKLVKYEGGAPMVLNTSPPAQRKPLTDKQRSKMYRAAVLRGDSIMLRSDYELGIIDAEAAHGIKE